MFVTSFLGFGFIFYNAFPDFELGASKVIVDKHNYHMKEIVLGRHWVSAHMIDLMDIYNTSIVIRNRNFQAQANVSDSAFLARIIDKSRLITGWQLLTIL